MLWSTGSRAVRMFGSSRPSRSTAQAGFTLVEILVAFTLLALMLGALLPTFSSGLRSMDEADSRVRAVLLAQSMIEMMGNEVPLEEGDRQGTSEEGFRWVVNTRRVALAADAREEESTLPFLTFEVEMTVFKDDQPQITLKTLRLAPIE